MSTQIMQKLIAAESDLAYAAATYVAAWHATMCAPASDAALAIEAAMLEARDVLAMTLEQVGHWEDERMRAEENPEDKDPIEPVLCLVKGGTN